MAGLVFLWQNIVAPTAVNTDYGLKPQILISDESPSILVGVTGAVFDESVTLVNDTTTTVNSDESTVGGSDAFSWMFSNPLYIDFMKPIFVTTEIESPVLLPSTTDGVFGDTTTLVNDTIMTVNGNSFVGGSDIISGEKPVFFKVGNL